MSIAWALRSLGPKKAHGPSVPKGQRERKGPPFPKARGNAWHKLDRTGPALEWPKGNIRAQRRTSRPSTRLTEDASAPPPCPESVKGNHPLVRDRTQARDVSVRFHQKSETAQPRHRVMNLHCTSKTLLSPSIR